MKPATLFREYIWLINTIHRHQRLTFEELNQHWMKTEMSGGVAMARSTFNRHRDDIVDMFGIIIDCEKKGGYRHPRALAPMASRYREAMPPRCRLAV